MNTLTIQLPESLMKPHGSPCRQRGLLGQSVCRQPAGEKLGVVLTMDYLRREAAAGRRETSRSTWRPCQTSRRRKTIVFERNRERRKLLSVAI